MGNFKSLCFSVIRNLRVDLRFKLYSSISLLGSPGHGAEDVERLLVCVEVPVLVPVVVEGEPAHHAQPPHAGQEGGHPRSSLGDCSTVINIKVAIRHLYVTFNWTFNYC